MVFSRMILEPTELFSQEKSYFFLIECNMKAAGLEVMYLFSCILYIEETIRSSRSGASWQLRATHQEVFIRASFESAATSHRYGYLHTYGIHHIHIYRQRKSNDGDPPSN